MGPPSYMRNVVDRNVVMRRKTKWQKLWPHIIRRTVCVGCGWLLPVYIWSRK